MEKKHSPLLGIGGAVVMAIVASFCCVGPFVLVLLGVSGAWIGGLRAFEPYRPMFIFFTISFLALGFYRTYIRPAKECKGILCASPETNKRDRIALWLSASFIIFLLVLPYLIGFLV